MKLPILKKIMRDLVREKTFLLALILQIIIILSMTILLNYTTLFYNPEQIINQPIKIGYLEDTKLIDNIYRSDKVKLIRYEILNNSIEDFKIGKIDGVIYEQTKTGNFRILNLYVPTNELKAALVVSLLKSSIDKYDSMINNEFYNNEYIIPIDKITIQKPVYKGVDVVYEILYGFLLPFIIIVPIFLIGTLIIDLLAEEIETKRLHLLLSVINIKRVLFEVIAAGILLILIQDILWIGLITLKGITIKNILPLLLYTNLLSILILTWATIISMLFKNKSQSQLVYSIIVVFITALTNVTILSPVNTITHIILGISKINLNIFLTIILLNIVSILVLNLITKRTKFE